MDSTGLRQIDAAVAEAMGWTLHVTGYPVALWLDADGIATGYCDQPWPADTERYGDAPALFSPKGVWSPRTDVSAALRVVDAYNGIVYMERDLGGMWTVVLGEISRISATAKPLSLAICLAFLRAMGVEVPSE